jgi:hypothetical protein
MLCNYSQEIQSKASPRNPTLKITPLQVFLVTKLGVDRFLIHKRSFERFNLVEAD